MIFNQPGRINGGSRYAEDDEAGYYQNHQARNNNENSRNRKKSYCKQLTLQRLRSNQNQNMKVFETNPIESAEKNEIVLFFVYYKVI